MSAAFSIDIEGGRGAFRLALSLTSGQSTVAIVGPSGAGKSTLLGLLAGLDRPTRGRIAIGGTTLFASDRRIDVPAHQRELGVAFQEDRLFPHCTVLENLRYGARRSGPAIIEEREAIDGLALGPLLDRTPHQLSGGERKRVAIARALLSHPRALLLDEPFSSLDPRLRHATIDLVRRAIERAALPTLVVTHHIEEALLLTDELLVLRAGRAVAHGKHLDLAHHPEVARNAGWDVGENAGPRGFLNVLHGTLEGDGPSRSLRLGSAEVRLSVSIADAPVAPADASRHSVAIRAHDIAIATGRLSGVSIRNQLPARVERLSEHGEVSLVEARLDGTEVSLVSEISTHSARALALSPGSAVILLIKTQAIRPLTAATEPITPTMQGAAPGSMR